MIQVFNFRSIEMTKNEIKRNYFKKRLRTQIIVFDHRNDCNNYNISSD